MAEFSAYLDHWSDSIVLTDIASGVWDSWTQSGDLEVERAQYSKHFPGHSDRVMAYYPGQPLLFDLGYCVFANLAKRFLRDFEQNQIPFVFTLYPGGGFALLDDRSDARLRRIFSSPMFRHVIVTQPVTAEYVASRYWIRPEQMSYLFGGPLWINHDALQRPSTKDGFDVCFVANKYSAYGRDKGYDVFVDAAHRLRSVDSIRFHVVGNFSPTDIDVSGLGSRITFYGSRPNSFFPEFYRQMDAIVSPNRASTLSSGAFDGFPTGACAEAGASGVVVLCSDPLRQNDRFSDDELILVGENGDEIASRLRELADDPAATALRAARGAMAFRRTYGTEEQIAPRLALLESLMP